MPFYRRDLSIRGLWHPWGVLEPVSRGYRGMTVYIFYCESFPVHLSPECLDTAGSVSVIVFLSLSLIPYLSYPEFTVEFVHYFPMNNSLLFALCYACLPLITLALAYWFSFCSFIL